MARPFSNPIPIKTAIDWFNNRQAKHLVSLVDTQSGSDTYGKVLRFGKLDTVNAFLSEISRDKTYLKVMTYSELVQYYSVVSGTDTDTTTSDASDDEVVVTVSEVIDTTDEVIPTTKADKKVNKPISSIAGANAIAELIQSAINQAMDVESLKELAQQKMDEAIRDLVKPNVISVKVSDDADPIPVGTVHKNFEQLLAMCAAKDKEGNRLNILLHGPAGTSKSFSAKQVAKALNLPFYPCSAVSSKFELFGFIDANGKAVRTPFYYSWVNGGVFSFDELSASDENAFLSFNGALANGIAPFPDGAVERHPDCVIIAGDNVLGGATAEYNGRNMMDKATMDRFLTLEWPIDANLERTITGNNSWVDMVQRARKVVEDKGIKVLITPRASINGEALLRAGMTVAQAARATMRKDMSDTQWKQVCEAANIPLN